MPRITFPQSLKWKSRGSSTTSSIYSVIARLQGADASRSRHGMRRTARQAQGPKAASQDSFTAAAGLVMQTAQVCLASGARQDAVLDRFLWRPHCIGPDPISVWASTAIPLSPELAGTDIESQLLTERTSQSYTAKLSRGNTRNRR